MLSDPLGDYRFFRGLIHVLKTSRRIPKIGEAIFGFFGLFFRARQVTTFFRLFPSYMIYLIRPIAYQS